MKRLNNKSSITDIAYDLMGDDKYLVDDDGRWGKLDRFESKRYNIDDIHFELGDSSLYRIITRLNTNDNISVSPVWYGESLMVRLSSQRIKFKLDNGSLVVRPWFDKNEYKDYLNHFKLKNRSTIINKLLNHE